MQPAPSHSEQDPTQTQSPAAAVLEAVQPIDVSVGEGRIHAMRARHAQLAMSAATQDAAGALKRLADPVAATKAYPLAATGVAAGVGLVVTLALKKSPQQKAAARLRALERAMAAEAVAGGKVNKPKPTGGFSKVARLAWRFGRPTLTAALMKSLTQPSPATAPAAAAEQQPETPMQDVT
jgi:hypothetical protein